MSNWIIRCANPRCRHVCHDRDWVLKPKKKPTEDEIKLRTQQSHCPKCDCISYYKAKPHEIAKAGLADKSPSNGNPAMSEAKTAGAASSPFSVPAFDGRVKEPLRRFAWWSWHPNYPHWSQSCWGGATIEEAMAEIELPIAFGMDVYHNKLIREDDGGKLVEVVDRPCKRPEVWERIAAAKRPVEESKP